MSEPRVISSATEIAADQRFCTKCGRPLKRKFAWLECSGCSYCYCSDCAYCAGCAYCSDCSRKENVKGETADFVPPTIPKIENIHQRIYEAASRPKALAMSEWHTCANTHCRAGWVVHLAGEGGYALERFHNTALAAQLIYRESGTPINPGRFSDSNADALADMKRLAETCPS